MTKNFIKTVSPIRSFSDEQELSYQRKQNKKTLKADRKKDKIQVEFECEWQNAAFN